MDSDFNTLSTPIDVVTERIEIGSSMRFRYYKTRRNGVLHFLKTPTPEFSADLISLEALRKEFMLGYGLNHPNIARYYSLQDNCLYEEYIDGETLKDIIDNNDRRLQEKDFLQNVCSQILDALKYMHNKGILHLDLKPENIMVSRLGNRIKIIDLSCAASAECDSTPGCTWEYMAPEQTFGRPEIATDLYQVGKVMSHLAEAAGSNKVWRQFIDKATAELPDNRFRNADEAIKAIPFSNNTFRKWIITIVPALIVCGILTAFISYPGSYDKAEVKEQPVTIENVESQLPEMQSQETVAQRVITIQQPKNSKSSSPALPSEAEIENMLTKKIEKKLEELYSVRVFPMYEKMMADESYKNSEGRSREFINTYSKELDNLMTYGEKLKAEYPDYASFIDEKIIRTFETRNSKMLLKLFPYKEQTTKEENS